MCRFQISGILTYGFCMHLTPPVGSLSEGYRPCIWLPRDSGIQLRKNQDVATRDTATLGVSSGNNNLRNLTPLPAPSPLISHPSSFFVFSLAFRGLPTGIDKLTPCRFSSKRTSPLLHSYPTLADLTASRVKPSPWRSSHPTRSTMSNPRSKTRKGSPQTNNDSSSPVNNLKMVELCPTTISKRSRLCTSS